MKVRHGRYGAFLGCTNYPECRSIVNIPKKGEEYTPEEEMPDCPAIDCPGKLVARRSRFGKIFYSCSTYPECDVIGNSVDEVMTKYPDHPRTAYVSKKKFAKKGEKTTEKAGTKKEAKKAAAKPKATKKKAARKMPNVELSDDLAAVVGAKEMTRGEVTKALWVYIKEKNLQDAKDKRMIVPDEKLTKIFGSADSVSMFKMAGLLTKHMK
jgi:DNA topoisomerase-1